MRNKTTIRQRTPARPNHARVQVALKILIQGAGAAGNQRCSKNRVEEEQEIKAVPRSHIESDERRDQYQECDARFRQFYEIGHAHSPPRQFQRCYFHAGTPVRNIA